MSVEFYWVMALILFFCLAIAFVYVKQGLNQYIEDKIMNICSDFPDYPWIDIRQDVTDKSAPIEFLMEYPYQISGTCNKIDYITQRFRTWPTQFQKDRFRHHCIYEYEKSGKSKVIDYADCDGYK